MIKFKFQNNKKGQIKMFENVGVLVIFFFLLMMGVIFYFNYQESSLKKQVRDLNRANAFRTAEIIFNLPELACYYNTVRFYSCIDAQKMRIFKDYLKNNLETYFPLFGFSKIKIGEDVIYEYSPGIKSESYVYSLPVIIYEPSQSGIHCGLTPLRGSCKSAILTVEYYA